MKKAVIAGIVVLLALVAWRLWLAGPRLSEDARETITAEGGAPTTVYTLADLAAHASATDCWIALGGVVYDASAYVATAPGAALASSCGTDGTARFAELDLDAQDAARASLERSRIGDLAL